MTLSCVSKLLFKNLTYKCIGASLLAVTTCDVLAMRALDVFALQTLRAPSFLTALESRLIHTSAPKILTFDVPSILIPVKTNGANNVRYVPYIKTKAIIGSTTQTPMYEKTKVVTLASYNVALMEALKANGIALNKPAEQDTIVIYPNVLPVEDVLKAAKQSIFPDIPQADTLTDITDVMRIATYLKRLSNKMADDCLLDAHMNKASFEKYSLLNHLGFLSHLTLGIVYNDSTSSISKSRDNLKLKMPTPHQFSKEVFGLAKTKIVWGDTHDLYQEQLKEAEKLYERLWHSSLPGILTIQGGQKIDQRLAEIDPEFLERFPFQV
ncbi:MAG: hypothetical protein V4482_06860 [Pseudomonadota bacterium]